MRSQTKASMLHAVDDTHDFPDRQRWIGLLAATDPRLFDDAFRSLRKPDFVWLRRPETGLVMVRGRIGGTGDRFNLGEITVTRCTLRLASGETGYACVRGRSHRHAELAAMADAMLQCPSVTTEVKALLLAPAHEALERERAQRERKAQSTRVDFLTLAREAGE